MTMKFPSGNYPSSVGSSGGDLLVHWCHGAPGWIHLFALAYKVRVIFEFCKGVPNSGFRLFGRIRIVLWTIRRNKNTNMNSVAGWAFWRCTCCSDIYHLHMSLAYDLHVCMLSSHDPLPFIRLIVSQSQAVWARADGTDWVKSAVNVSSSALCRLTICIRSDDTIRPNTNTLFGALFCTEVNTKRMFGTSVEFCAVHLRWMLLDFLVYQIFCAFIAEEDDVISSSD